MTVTITVEFYDEDLFERVARLFATYFPSGDKLLDAGYSRWLYLDNPMGRARIIAAHGEANEWVGFMALIPVDLTRLADTQRAYYVVNVLVHPKYHGKHVFGRMIAAARDLVQGEGAALMGHPNDLALRSWQRSKMHFHEPLKPYLVKPTLWQHGITRRRALSAGATEAACTTLRHAASRSERWNIAVSPSYLSWRFFTHPVNRYDLHVVSANGSPVGVLVARKVRPILHLLVDHLVLPEYESLALGQAPLFSVLFMPTDKASEVSSAAWKLPVKKEIPFFLTRYGEPIVPSSVVDLGLSASDF